MPVTDDVLLEMQRRMLRIRIFEEHAIKHHSRGRIPGPLHTTIGQEATVVGTCMALREDDYITGTHRSHGHPIGKGAALGPLMAELMGKRGGVCGGKGGSMHLADFSVGSLGESGIVGGALPIATGAALSAVLRGTDQVSVGFFGDGAANIGTFHESLNLAAIWGLPALFVCENNGYALTTPFAESCAVEDIAVRGASYGIPGVVVDGQDVEAVHAVVTDAVERARRGAGPSLIECKTYRYRDHAEFGGVSSAVSSYRPQEELLHWMTNRDPIDLFEARLIEGGVVSAEEAAALRDAVETEVKEADAFAAASPFPDPEEAFVGVYTRHVAVRR